MLKKIVQVFGGDPNKREIEKYSQVVNEINSLENEFEALSNDALKNNTAELALETVENRLDFWGINPPNWFIGDSNPIRDNMNILLWNA